MKYFRKIIKIRAEDSPNVIHKKDVLPGVLTYPEYLQRRATWDRVSQCIGLDAEFWEGADALMFPVDWLNRAEAKDLVDLCRRMPTEAIGIDPAEGGDDTAMVAGNRYGVKELVSKQTPNTAVIVSEALAFIRKHGMMDRPNKIAMDRGGGGKQHADRLRQDHDLGVLTVAFGESLVPDLRRGLTPFAERFDNREERYVYKNRRAEMYWNLRLRLDPSNTEYQGFAIPPEYQELRRQLAPIPVTYDPEGRIELLPKQKRNADDKKMTLTELIGCSPDEADATVLMLHALNYRSNVVSAGAPDDF